MLELYLECYQADDIHNEVFKEWADCYSTEKWEYLYAQKAPFTQELHWLVAESEVNRALIGIPGSWGMDKIINQFVSN